MLSIVYYLRTEIILTVISYMYSIHLVLGITLWSLYSTSNWVQQVTFSPWVINNGENQSLDHINWSFLTNKQTKMHFPWKYLVNLPVTIQDVLKLSLRCILFCHLGQWRRWSHPKSGERKKVVVLDITCTISSNSDLGWGKYVTFDENTFFLWIESTAASYKFCIQIKLNQIKYFFLLIATEKNKISLRLWFSFYVIKRTIIKYIQKRYSSTYLIILQLLPLGLIKLFRCKMIKSNGHLMHNKNRSCKVKMGVSLFNRIQNTIITIANVLMPSACYSHGLVM